MRDPPAIQPATLLSSTSHVLPNRLLVTELFFSVPLVHSDSNGRTIKLFCRSAERPAPALPSASSGAASTDAVTATANGGASGKSLPYLVYINGGPGFPCPAPEDMLSLTNYVLDKGYKLLCFDHRGMGMSSPITARSLSGEADGDAGVEGQVAFLKKFRATEAVRDLEALRLCLTSGADKDGIQKRGGSKEEKWSIMGQSYGGFVCTTYLSFYPDGLREAWIMGGLPPVLERRPDNVIRGLVRKVRERNDKYYSKYPEDVRRVNAIVEYLRAKQDDGDEVRLPAGGTLSTGRFLELGINFGFHAGLDRVHAVVLRVFRDLSEEGEISRPALGMLERQGAFDEHILYAVLHEALYCQGQAAEWAFDRVLAEEDGFGVEQGNQRYLFTGEMVFHRAFEDYVELREARDVMDRIMREDEWPELYDVEQLERNAVPVFAAVFVEDMYVGFETSLTTANLIRGCKMVVTNQMYHDAVRGKTEEVLKAMFALRDDYID